MKTKLESYGLSVPQAALTIACCLFSLASVFHVIARNGDLFEIFYCLATIPFVCIPALLCPIFKWRLNSVFYAVFSFYALGPLLGAVYHLYYVTGWWDDLLHILAGTLFAAIGVYLAHFLNRGNKTSCVLSALFGLCFSLGIAVAWELFEFSSDLLLGSDMQADTVIHSISTKIGRTDGTLTVFDRISDVSVNGRALGIGGYLDIGLIDTMCDMAVETFGALLFMIYALIDRDRHPVIVSVRGTSNSEAVDSCANGT